MKKFLSLVLALIMTMSLVTISAGATEYRDLTDKDEIQYEEAVAVLNRIGVITGYEDGSFRPETELTRGAAAKIIVSLLIGPEAASNLPNTTAPYPDVPASHTFAGVISYCKTAKIISGYGDGTFKPGNSLTGFAFAKMLLGALGYKSDIEGFVDTGWTMNVAKVGNVTGLFDRLDFDGAAAVNRETACQLALNTLKATMVTYGGTTLVTGAQALAVQGTQAMYVTSNNREINANINRRVISAANNEMTLEFGEEHFKDLRLEHDKYDPAYDDFGHPSNEWSWKKVTIGTFKLPADFTFTKQMSHLEDTAATKEKALGLRNYDTWSMDHRASSANWNTASSLAGLNGAGFWNSPFADATQIHINGWKARVNDKGKIVDYDANMYNANKKPDGVPTIAEIADLTDNGVTVEVYVCPVDADFITDVVVTRTQLMKVKRIGSDYVTLEDIEPDSRSPRKDSKLADITGYNNFAIDVTADYDSTGKNSFLADVKDSNYDAYNALKDMKVGDRVAVVPYTTDNGKTWEVGEAYAPETVSGALTQVENYANVNKRAGSAVSITVGGTSYPINEWNKDMLDITTNKLKATKKDVTLYLAKDGTALWASNIGSAEAWMIVGDYYQATSASLGGKVGWYVHGWTIGGDEVDLDLGTIRGDAEKYAPGELVHYYVAEAGNGEYALEKPNYNSKNHYKDGSDADDRYRETGEGIYEVSQYTLDAKDSTKAKQYQISKRNGALALENYGTNPAKYTMPTVYNALKTTPTSDVGTTGLAYPVKHEDKTDLSTAAKNKLHDFKYSNLLYDGVKFIFVNFDNANGQVETIDFKDGVQNVDYQDLIRYNSRWENIGTNDGKRFVVSAAEAYVNNKGLVKAVVIKADSSEADLSKIAVITETWADRGYQSAGAEGDRPTGYSTGAKYVTGPNFNTAEEKTGYFDKPVQVGDIVIISEKDNLIIRKYFHSTYYNNGNPDAVYVEGIKTLKNIRGDDSEAGFLIGQTGSKVYTLNKSLLAPDGNSVTLVPGEDRKVDLLGSTYVSGFDTQVVNDLSGLVRVDGTTKFVDLIPGERKNIESMSDLLDYKPETVKLRLLVNGSDNTDTFRHAYAVIVEAAELKNDGNKGQDTTSTTLYAYNTIREVNEALTKGNVTITGTWAPTDTSNLLEIPAGKTLTVQGDFNANSVRGITFGSTSSKLDVTGTLSGVKDNLTNANANVSARNVTIAGSFDFRGTMTVGKQLNVGANTLTVSGSVTVGSASDAGVVTGTATGNIVVVSAHSLRILGKLATVDTITIYANRNAVSGRVASENGYVKIEGTLTGTATFIDNNVAPSATTSAPTQEIVSVKGAITMGAASKLSTDEFKPTTATLTTGAEITLQKGVTTGSDASDSTNLVVKDKNGTVIDNTTEPTKIVISGAAGAQTTVSSGQTVVTEETPTTVTTVVPFETSAAKIVTSKADLLAWGRNVGITGSETELLQALTGKSSWVDDPGEASMPWLCARLTVAADTVPAGTVVTGTVLKDGKAIATDTWNIAEEKLKGNGCTFGWEMAASDASDVIDLPLKRGELSGTYSIQYTWTVNNAEVEGQTPIVAASAKYDEPKPLEVANIAAQNVVLEGTTLTINQLLTYEANGSQSLVGFGGDEGETFATVAGSDTYKAGIVVTVNNQKHGAKGVYTGLTNILWPHQGGQTGSFTSDKACLVLYVNAERYAQWKANPEGTLKFNLTPTNTHNAAPTFTYTVKMSETAMTQLKGIFEPEPPATGNTDV